MRVKVIVVDPFNFSLGRQRQVDVCDFKASLVLQSSRTVKLYSEKPYLKKKSKQKVYWINCLFVYECRCTYANSICGYQRTAYWESVLCAYLVF